MKSLYVNWLKENIDKYVWKQLTLEFNKNFNTNYKMGGIRAICKKNGIEKDKEIKKEQLYTVFTKEIREFIFENVNNYTNIELSKLIKEKFNVDIPFRKIGYFKVDEKRKRNNNSVNMTNGYKLQRIKNNKDIIDFIILNKDKYCRKELSRIVANEFKELDYATPYQVERVIKELKIKCKYSINDKTPKEILDFVKSIHNDYSDKEISKMLFEKFNYKISYKRISKWRTKLGIKKETRALFTKNEINKLALANYPIGTQKYVKNHGVMIKINNNEWKALKRVVWENYYGVKLNKEDNIINLDGNPYNCDISNLYLINEHQRNCMNGHKWYGYEKATIAGLEIIKAEEVLENKIKGV